MPYVSTVARTALRSAPSAEDRASAVPLAEGLPRSRRSILLSIPSGSSVTNLLRGGVLKTLLDEVPDLDVAIVSPFSAQPGFQREFARPGVSFALLTPYVATPIERIVESVLREQFLTASGLEAVRLQRDRARLLDGWRGRSALAGTAHIVSRLPIPRRVWFAIAQATGGTRGYAALFKRYRPSLVVTATAGFFDSELPLIWEAKRCRVPQMGIDLAWDNLSSKYNPIRPVDHLAVWNNQMRDQAIRYHEFPSDRVAVTGAVQFDTYRERHSLPTRQAFLADMGAPVGSKLITLATSPEIVYASTDRIVDRLVRAVRDREMGAASFLLVRVHPRDSIERYDAWRELPFVRVEKPIARLDAEPGTQPFHAFAPTLHDRAHLAATLTHTDVLVNFASTTTLEACVFDTPVVNIGFDGEPGLPLPLSIRRYFQFEHYRPILQAGAARVASDPEELVGAVRAYLEDPARDRDARRSIVERFCGDLDGRAGERLARVVIDVLGRTASRVGRA